jgi:hypothetical protein
MANVYSESRVLFAAGPQTPLYKGMQVGYQGRPSLVRGVAFKPCMPLKLVAFAYKATTIRMQAMARAMNCSPPSAPLQEYANKPEVQELLQKLTSDMVSLTQQAHATCSLMLTQCSTC